VHLRRNFYSRKTAITADELCRCDFREVVVFGSDPEDGHSRGAALRQTPGEFDGGERFVESVERACEESRLLA
jgi:hypothetical protein